MYYIRLEVLVNSKTRKNKQGTPANIMDVMTVTPTTVTMKAMTSITFMAALDSVSSTASAFIILVAKEGTESSYGNNGRFSIPHL
jgi:hypothetical protein